MAQGRPYLYQSDVSRDPVAKGDTHSVSWDKVVSQHLLQDPVSDTGGMGKRTSHWSEEVSLERKGKG